MNLTLPSVGQPNATEDVDVVNAFSAIQSLVNGNVDELNVPNLAAAFTTYKWIERGHAQINQGAAAATYLIAIQGYFGVTSNQLAAGNAAANPSDFQMYLDPAAYTANARTTKLRIRATAVPNATAPGINFTVGLYPIATYGGAAGASPFIASIGAVVSGSTVTLTTPAANALAMQLGSDFNFPAAGAYCLAVAISGAGMPVNSVINVQAQLEMRQA